MAALAKAPTSFGHKESYLNKNPFVPSSYHAQARAKKVNEPKSQLPAQNETYETMQRPQVDYEAEQKGLADIEIEPKKLLVEEETKQQKPLVNNEISSRESLVNQEIKSEKNIG